MQQSPESGQEVDSERGQIHDDVSPRREVQLAVVPLLLGAFLVLFTISQCLSVFQDILKLSRLYNIIYIFFRRIKNYLNNAISHGGPQEFAPVQIEHLDRLFGDLKIYFK